ncbi:MAG: dihydrofolate reductase [Turicibacter sp.]|nr:dihydrofolate reductase [Turicibacter sp.]
MISLIVAFDKNRLIGAGNRLPWHFREDLKYFKETTMGHDLLMGKNTFESILSYGNKPLPGRHHFVLSRSLEYAHEQVDVVADLEGFLKNYPAEKELFIIGGSSVYTQVLPYVQRLYITHVEGEYEGDAYFPETIPSQWQEIRSRQSEGLMFAVYERSNPNG